MNRPNGGWLTGLEPATSGITIQRSNQLSYNHQVDVLIPPCGTSCANMRIPPAQHISS